MMKATELNAVHGAIIKEKILHDADDKWVSRKWVASRRYITTFEGDELTGFILYDIEDLDTEYLYIHMIWINPKYRRSKLASELTQRLMKHYSDVTIIAYANPQGRKVLKSLGFKIGKTKYRECILRR